MSDPTKPQKPTETAPKPPGTSKPPSHNPWDAIEPGHTVLYRASKDEGWFECVVTAVSKDGRKLTLKWRDYQGFKPFDVRRLSVGLICKVD